MSALQGGFIKESTFLPGAYVKKGQILARLTNPDYITLQQAYLETLNELRFAEQEYDRQKVLGEQNATAAKNLQQSESTYRVLKGRLAGMKARLQLLGIGITSLEDGNIQSVINLRAPINGYITAVNHFLGEFVESRDILFEIVNMDELHFELKVFEQDIARISKGQVVLLRPTGTNRMYSGKVFLVSPQRNLETRTFSIHGHFNEHGDELKPGMFVEAEILLSSDSLHALPEKALVFQQNEPYVLVEQEGRYELQPVETGGKMDGWIEIKNAEALRQKEIVTEGATRLFAAMKRGK